MRRSGILRFGSAETGLVSIRLSSTANEKTTESAARVAWIVFPLSPSSSIGRRTSRWMVSGLILEIRIRCSGSTRSLCSRAMYVRRDERFTLAWLLIASAA
jgi:hypothetical protein